MCTRIRFFDLPPSESYRLYNYLSATFSSIVSLLLR